MPFPPCPPEIKPIAHFLKVAEEHDARNIVVSYWARMHACQLAMKLTGDKKSNEVTKLLIALVESMEKTKKENMDNEGIINVTAAQALIEQYALQLFEYANAQDKAENFNKATIKAFYTAGLLMDVLEQFGPLEEGMQSKQKYAKWKAAYIHNCLKCGDVPIPGGPDEHLDNVIHRADMDLADNEPSSSEKENITDPAIPPNPEIITPQPSVSPPTPSSPYINPTPPQIPRQTSKEDSVNTYIPPDSNNSVTLSPDQVKKAQKYCKFADSALNYEDFNTAIDNLKRALMLLQTGKDS